MKKSHGPLRWKRTSGSRHTRRFRQALKRKRTLESRRKISGSVREITPSPILTLLRRKLTGNKRGIVEKDGETFVVQIPKVFGLTTNPEESLDVIASIVWASSQSRIRRLVFDHSKCVEMDLGASALLDVVALEVRREGRSKGCPYSFSGDFPDDPKVKELLICTGLLRSLGMKPPKEMDSHFKIFPLFRGHKAHGDQSRGGTKAVEASGLLARHVDDCLGVAGYSLTDDGQELVLRWAGEVIANAEDHSGQDSWFAAAYMDTTAEGVDGECHLTVFGFGRSIYESLNQSSTLESTREAFCELAATHKEMGFFEKILFGQRYSEGDLWTLYALQEGVSRFNGRNGWVDRGTGTVAMIETFQGFGGTSCTGKTPLMSLISGDSRILFDGRYHLGEVQGADGQMHHVIAFNAENDLKERPDHRNVHSLNNFFPGTIINFKFFIDRSYLEKRDANAIKSH